MSTEVGQMQIVLSANAVSYSKSLDEAAGKLDQLRGKADKVGHSTVSSVQAASGALRELNGDFTNNIRAVERFITTIPGVGDALKTVFPLVGVAAFGAMIVSSGEKLYAFQQQLHKMPDAIRQGFDAMNEATRKTGVELDVANDKLEIAIAKLEKTPVNALKLALDEDRLAASNLAETIEHANKQVGELLSKNSTAGLMKQIGGFVFNEDQASTSDAEKKIKGIMGRLQKAQDASVEAEDKVSPGADAEAVKLANRTNLQNALTAAINETNKALTDERGAAAKDKFAGHDDVIGDYEGVLRQLRYQQHNFQAGNRHSDLEVQQANDELAKQQAADARRAAAAAATAAMRNLENMRLQQEQAGKLGAGADLNFWSGNASAFPKGSEQYLQIQKKIAEDQKTLARYNEQYNTEEARGLEIRAKSAESLERANIQLDLASGKITKLEADTRMASAQAVEYTAKLGALRAQLAALNSDKTIAPEDKRSRAANLQNQISDAQGQQAAAEVEGKVRSVEATNAHDKAVRADNDALAKLAEINARNVGLMAAMVTAHGLSTGAVSKHAAALQTANTHASEYASQLAEIRKLQADIDAATGLTADDRKTKTDEASARMATIQGEAARSARADKWGAEQETVAGGFMGALREMTAAGTDYAAMMKAMTTSVFDGVNQTLTELMTTRNHQGQHLWRELGHDLSVKGTGTRLERTESRGTFKTGLFAVSPIGLPLPVVA